MRARMTRTLLLNSVFPLITCWPSDLLKNDCRKGAQLVAGGLLPPPIMGAVPDVDWSILRLSWATNTSDDGNGGDEYDGRPLRKGDTLELTYTNTRSKPFGVHVVFAASSGTIAGGEPCGAEGAVLRCSTCGGQSQWLRSATWSATEPGVVTLAVGAARGGYGTPAVHVGIVNVSVVAEAVGSYTAHEEPTTLVDARLALQCGNVHGVETHICGPE
mmetsp:Transcript_44831/g.117610  ORF Transcript_44831/g.117610 Transcript_44831/m.117610 type:complete len:216 (+) Transcript_44831:31-678(+)